MSPIFQKIYHHNPHVFVYSDNVLANVALHLATIIAIGTHKAWLLTARVFHVPIQAANPKERSPATRISAIKFYTTLNLCGISPATNVPSQIPRLIDLSLGTRGFVRARRWTDGLINLGLRVPKRINVLGAYPGLLHLSLRNPRGYF